MQFKNNFISSSFTKKWPGTISTSKSLMYTFTFDRDMKKFLKKYPNNILLNQTIYMTEKNEVFSFNDWLQFFYSKRDKKRN